MKTFSGNLEKKINISSKNILSPLPKMSLGVISRAICGVAIWIALKKQLPYWYVVCAAQY
jgi:hypothetical protein